MKRLLIAVSAVACAFGLRAADETWASGTSFEGATGALSDNLTVGELETLEAGSSYWAIPDNDANQDIAIKDYTSAGIDKPLDKRGARQKAEWVDDDNFLSIRTSFGKPLVRNLDLNGYGKLIGANGIYIDSQVKFTACDEAPTLTDEKLVVYVLEDDNGGQKLHINAGYISAAGAIERKDYECGDWGYADGWVRLTVKTIDNILSESGKQCPGFVVFINSTDAGSDPIACTETKCLLPMTDNAGAFGNALFPAYVSDITLDNNKLVSIGFDGQGALNDLIVNDEPPFDSAKDNVFFTLVKGENVTGFTYQVGSETPVPVTDTTKVKFVADGVITISDVTVADGYMPAALEPISMTEGGSATISAVKVGVTIGDQKFANFADAIAYINGASASGEVVVNFAADFTPEAFETSIQPGENVTSLTIDLAGKTLTYTGDEGYAIESAVALTINDSSNTNAGKIIAPNSNDGIVCYYNTMTVTGGTFDGYVSNDGSDEADITGGVFAGEEDVFYLWENNPKTIGGKTYKATYAEGYWTVAEQKTGWAIYLAGSGTQEAPYQIANEQDLIELATYMGTSADFPTEGVYFQQTADITLSAAFDGIGQRDMKDTLGSDLAAYTSANVFKGTYDGGNKTVSGVILKTGDYIGFFNSCYGATIKNLNISLGNATGWSDTASGQVGAVFAGVTVNTTLENCQTIVAGGNDTFKSSKTAAGFVGYAGHGTVLKDCVNNLNIWSAGNEKAGGFIACAQAGKSTGNGVEINGCSNLGDVKNNGSNAFIGGFVGYIDNFAVTFKGANVVQGTITPSSGYAKSLAAPNGGTVAVATGATFTVPAGIKTVTDGKAVDGLIYATVDGNVATLVKASALAAGGTYKVMATGGAPVIELGAGQSITFDQTLATIDAKGITTAVAGYEVTKSGNAYTATAITYNITFTSQDGTTAPEAMTYTVNSTFPLALADATTENDSIEFKGWTNATYTTAIKAIPELPATLGNIALVAQWDAVVAPEDWDNPKVDPAIPGTKAADAWPSLKDTPLAQADASKLVTWAKDTTKGNITFDKAAEIKVEAFLLDCANTEQAVVDAKKAFKVTSITQDEDGKWVAKVGEAGDGEEYKNGYINIVPYDLEGAGDDAEFFQATLTLQPAE